MNLIHAINDGFRALEELLGDTIVLVGYGIVLALDAGYRLAGRLDAEQAGEHWD